MEWMNVVQWVPNEEEKHFVEENAKLKVLISFQDQTIFAISETTVFFFGYSTSLAPNLDFS